jgi:CheY-like chemotaxis protein
MTPAVLDSPAMRVLVIEDEEALREVFRDFLIELGHQPVIVRSAEAALGTLQTERPDAIILDIHLPGMSGLDFMQLRPVRESGLPIVAVSGIVTESQARECLRLGALDFVGKPVPLERLQDVLTYLEPHAIHRRRESAADRVERRQAPRARITLPVSLREYRGSAWDGTCVEISVSGMKLRTDASLAAGTAVKCSFTPPDGGEPIDVISIVVRRDSTGTVVSFVNLPAHEERRLADLVRRTVR